MRIVNIDAPKELAELFVEKKIPKFVTGFVKTLEGKYYEKFQDFQDISNNHSSPSPVWSFECSRYENIAVLLHSIPIYLRNIKSERQDGIVDALGAYICCRGRYTPYIELYLAEISDQAAADVEAYHPKYADPQKKKKKEIYFKYLVTKVLFHELAHAALDIFNLASPPSSEKISYSTDFGKWREESMANAVALQIIKEKSKSIENRNTGATYTDNSGKDLSNNVGIYEYAKKFVESQDPEYALGALMEDFDDKDFNSVFEAKIKGIDKGLQDKWLEYAKNGAPNWADLKDWNKKLLEDALSRV